MIYSKKFIMLDMLMISLQALIAQMSLKINSKIMNKIEELFFKINSDKLHSLYSSCETADT